jgi:DUF1365 family protein
MSPPSSILQSALYECRVMHHRFAPKEHRFDYRIFLFALDLDELPACDRQLALFSVNRRNLYSFREEDYLPTGEALHRRTTPSAPAAAAPEAPARSLKERVVAYLAERGIDLTGGRVVLLTLPRVAGYLFNPVSFYFCYDRAGVPAAALAEVTNTFREMKTYFLGADPVTGAAAPFRLRTPKHFYVSPYSDVDVAFDFRLRVPGDRLDLRIDDFAGESRTLASSLTGARRPLTGLRLAGWTIKYPLITLRVISLIHWHALRLWLKRVPWFAKSARPQDQRDLYRPHPSVAAPVPSDSA